MGGVFGGDGCLDECFDGGVGFGYELEYKLWVDKLDDRHDPFCF